MNYSMLPKFQYSSAFPVPHVSSMFQLAVDEKRGKSQLMLLYEEITKEELAKQHRKEHKKQKRKKKKEKKHELEEKENSCEVRD